MLIHSDRSVALPPQRQDRRPGPSAVLAQWPRPAQRQHRLRTRDGLVTAPREPQSGGSVGLRAPARRDSPSSWRRRVDASLPPGGPGPPAPAAAQSTAQGPGPERADLPGPPPHLGSLPVCLPGGRRVRAALPDRGVQRGLPAARSVSSLCPRELQAFPQRPGWMPGTPSPRGGGDRLPDLPRPNPCIARLQTPCSDSAAWPGWGARVLPIDSLQGPALPRGRRGDIPTDRGSSVQAVGCQRGPGMTTGAPRAVSWAGAT